MAPSACASTMCSTCAARAPTAAAQVRVCVAQVFWSHAPGVKLSRSWATPCTHRLHGLHRAWCPAMMLVVGASEIESEDRSPVSLRSALELLSAAHSVMPAVGGGACRCTPRPTCAPRSTCRRSCHLLSRVKRASTRINERHRHGWLVAPGTGGSQALARAQVDERYGRRADEEPITVDGEWLPAQSTTARATLAQWVSARRCPTRRSSGHPPSNGQLRAPRTCAPQQSLADVRRHRHLSTHRRRLTHDCTHNRRSG